MEKSIVKNIYLVSPKIDFLAMGGASLLFFPLLAFFNSTQTNDWIISLSLFLMWVCNWPHFFATLSQLYDRKENAMQYPWTSLFLPVLVMALCLSTLSFPLVLGAYVVKIYTLWAPYHFSGQSVGVALLYSRKAGIYFSNHQRRSLSWLVYGSFLVLVGRGESTAWTMNFVGLSYSSLNLPSWVGTLSYVWFATCFGYFIVNFYKNSFWKCLPRIVFLPIGAQLSWFLLGPYYVGFNQLVPFFHSLQYLPIIWIRHRHSQAVPEKFLSYFRFNFIGGAFIFWALPILLTLFGFRYEYTRPIVFAFINLHHFIIDGVIWKLRDSRVSEAYGNAVKMQNTEGVQTLASYKV